MEIKKAGTTEAEIIPTPTVEIKKYRCIRTCTYKNKYYKEDETDELWDDGSVPEHFEEIKKTSIDNEY